MFTNNNNNHVFYDEGNNQMMMELDPISFLPFPPTTITTTSSSSTPTSYTNTNHNNNHHHNNNNFNHIIPQDRSDRSSRNSHSSKRLEPDFRAASRGSPVTEFVHDMRLSLPRTNSTGNGGWTINLDATTISTGNTTTTTIVNNSFPANNNNNNNDIPVSFNDQSKKFRQAPYVCVKTLSGTTIRLEFPDQTRTDISILDVKRLLFEVHGVDPMSTRLLVDRQIVSDHFDLKLVSGTTIHLVASFGGAGGSDDPTYTSACTLSWESIQF
jgi:hypothetical protein